MGGETFMCRYKGKTAREAFSAAVQEARYEHGQGGYTGTIAEKDSFVMIEAPAEADAAKYASALLNDGDRRIDNKWGPAGCITLGDEWWLFFGWASS